MVKRYKLEVITDHLPRDGFLPRVRVIEDFDDHSTSATFSILNDEFSKQIIPQMVTWCEENECGYRTSYDTFKFRNHEQLTMFILRWS